MNILRFLVIMFTITIAYSAMGGKKLEKATTLELTKAEFLEKVYNYEKNPQEWKYLGKKPILIDFYASWCGPCKMIAPILEELASEYGDKIQIYKINTDKEKELARAFGISGLPSLLFIPMEETPQMVRRAMNKEALKEAINTILLKNNVEKPETDE